MIPLKPIKNNSFQIIAGDHRGKRFSFVEANGLRPTSGKARQMLFNWIQFSAFDKTYLDCFSGSGALGFEALSRGAKQVISIEKHKRVAQVLKKNAAKLNSTKIQIIHRDALKAIETGFNITFDFIFLDPPFHQGLIEKTLTSLSNKDFISPSTQIYIESEYPIGQTQIKQLLTPKFNIIKQKHTKQVHYCLLKSLL